MLDRFAAAAFHAEFEDSTGVFDDESLRVVFEEPAAQAQQERRWCISPVVAQFRT